MKKPTLEAALAQKQPPTIAIEKDVPLPPAAKRAGDGRVTTTLRIEPERLEALKIVAAKKRVKVNDLLLEGAAHVLALHGSKA